MCTQDGQSVNFFVTGIELTGLQPKTHAEITRDFFTNIRANDPTITFDDAILRFENGTSTYTTLDTFATARCRLAESYRKVYRPYWS